MMQLYDYYRSSCSYRVRIALNIKQLDYSVVPINLVNDGGEQFSEAYTAINPQQLVPSLDTEDGIINQSLAILEYLDERYTKPSLLPKNSYKRAQVRSLMYLIACEIHPLNNLRVLKTLKLEYSISDDEKLAWYHNWLRVGFDALENKLNQFPREVPVCFEDNITMADLCLVPQVYNAKRFEFNLDDYPLINSINEYCLNIQAFSKSAP